MVSIQKSQSGFSVMESLLILVVLVIIGGAGFYIYNANKRTNSTYNSASQDSQKSKTKTTASTTSNLQTVHTPQQATAFVQTTYNNYLAAIKNAGAGNTQPLGLVGLSAVKGNLTSDFYAQAVASHNGSGFSCAAQFVPSKYTASLASSNATTASVAVSISIDNQGGTSASGPLTASVDLASLKITAVSCPN